MARDAARAKAAIIPEPRLPSRLQTCIPNPFGAERRIGDAGLDSDTDRSGTGERLGATPDTEFEGAADISPDRIIPVPDDEEPEAEEG